MSQHESERLNRIIKAQEEFNEAKEAVRYFKSKGVPIPSGIIRKFENCKSKLWDTLRRQGGLDNSY